MKPTGILPETKINESLKNHTTFAIGGPAKYFYAAKTSQDLIEAVTWAQKQNLPWVILGNGSNVLVSDKGFSGLVIKNQTSAIEVLSQQPEPHAPPKITPRFKPLEADVKQLNQDSYPESDYPPVLVKLDSGVTLPKAIFYLLSQGITGLEWFAGIPATVGGATFINLHGGDKYWSDYLVSAEIIGKNGNVKSVPADYFQYGYDQSHLKTSHDVVLSNTLRLYQGPKEKALAIAKLWALKKAHQPQRSAGCLFQNLSVEEQKQLDLPTPSIGFVIDKQLGLKGTVKGGARIAEKHAGFVENLGGAKAADVYYLIKLVKDQALAKLNLKLDLEIVLLGFSQSQLAAIGEDYPGNLWHN